MKVFLASGIALMVYGIASFGPNPGRSTDRPADEVEASEFFGGSAAMLSCRGWDPISGCDLNGCVPSNSVVHGSTAQGIAPYVGTCLPASGANCGNYYTFQSGCATSP